MGFVKILIRRRSCTSYFFFDIESAVLFGGPLKIVQEYAEKIT